MKRFIRSILGKMGLRLTTSPSYRELESLIQELRPVPVKLIRLGPKGDGGYLVPDDLEGIRACLSPGVDRLSGFEEECAERGMDVYMVDASVEKPQIDHPCFHFRQSFIGAATSGDFITLDRWAEEEGIKGCQGDLLLQMDIEGHEYEALLAVSEGFLARFRIIVIEFHNLQNLYQKHTFRLMAPVFRKLLLTHNCVHIHPNNLGWLERWKNLEIPSLAEFSFLRRDREFLSPPKNPIYPHPLDSENTEKRPMPLPSCWRTE